MKKFIFIIIVLFGLVGGYFFRSNLQKAQEPIERNTLGESIEATPTPQVAEPSVPKRIIIPSLDVDAVVEHVGKDKEGKMDVPSGVFNTAWYELGARPGEDGNAVIAAHFDTPTGAPSVFYKLNTMQKGDEIISIDEKGTKYIFQVTDVIDYPNDEFPIKTVFGSTTTPQLNLITCAGVFDQSAKNYSERTVVFSELVDIKEES